MQHIMIIQEQPKENCWFNSHTGQRSKEKHGSRICGLSKKNLWECSDVGHYENPDVWTDVKDVFISDNQHENENQYTF